MYKPFLLVCSEECEYSGVIELIDILTGVVKTLKVSYRGSADELHTDTFGSI